MTHKGQEAAIHIIHVQGRLDYTVLEQYSVYHIAYSGHFSIGLVKNIRRRHIS